MSDYFAILKVQQGRLKRAMQEKGITSAAGLSRLTGVAQATAGDLLNFRESPKLKNGEWRKPVLAICHALGYLPEELFPESLGIVSESNRIEGFVTHAQLAGAGENRMLSPCEEIEQGEIIDTLYEVLDTLPENEKEAVTSYFLDGETCTNVGSRRGVGPSQASQLMRKGLKRLRHPAKLKRLAEVWRNS